VALTKTRLPASEELLLDYARRLDRHRVGRRALWIHLARLERQNRHDGDIKLGANVMRPLARKFHGEVFALATSDIVVCLKDPDDKAVESALFDLRFSFARDPLMKRVDEEGPDAYLTVYDIAKSYDTFLQAVKAACTRRAAAAPEPPEQPEETPGARLIFSRAELRAKAPATLPGHVDTSQGRIAVERLLERQTIGRLVSPTMAKAWGKREGLRAQALDAFDHLNVAVSRHQITRAAAHSEIECLLIGGWCNLLRAEGTERTFLLLRNETLMSAEFLTFDRWISENRLERPSLALYVEDTIEDTQTADYLRSFLRERQYRIGIGAVPLVDLARLRPALGGLSFIELAMPAEITSRDKELLARVVGEWGEETVLATGVGDPKALEKIHEAGIRLVSGSALKL
jgi:hypothetical protein